MHSLASMIDERAKRKRLALYYGGATVCLIAVIILAWLLFFRLYVYTNDAYVEGNQIYITPLQPGFVTAIHTDDTFLVTKGQLLIELDTTDAKIALDQAERELASAVRTVCELFHQVFVYRSEIEVKKAQWIRAIQDYNHREEVVAQEGVSIENFEHSIAALRESYFSLQLTEKLLEKALSVVQATSLTTHPLVLQAADRLRKAWVQLYQCNIYAPATGLTAQRTIQVGMWTQAGQPLLSVIPLDQIWVNANFKETQLKHMRIGQRVRLTSDLYGKEVVYQGKIVGLPGGAGNAFSLLPPQNLSGNWIKIVQRLPVRVALNREELKKYPLRIGLSMEATVDLEDQKGKLVPTSTLGSPHYTTAIFEEEEMGDLRRIEEVIEANLDPLLLMYKDEPLELDIQTSIGIDSEEFKKLPLQSQWNRVWQ